MCKIKAVIFDMDGVIIDSEPIHIEIEKKLIKKMGIELDSKQHESYIGMTMEALWEQIRSDFKLNYSVEELVENHKKEVYNYLASSALPLFPNIKNLILESKQNNLETAVASSSPKKIIELVVNKLDINCFFDYLISGEQVQKSKPYPDIFLQTAKQLRVSPNQCLVIEDSSNGVKAAKAAEMKCIGFQNPNSGNQDLSVADFIINSKDEVTLKEIINI
ncbi:HAD family hydrolase [Natranaerobius trueperi]|uniref:Beta-phosphoglucomutase n=1 Tax=Natranaerobius trueperi TaxID=759412 RepID=A0A226C082_9FIRM|nr:HAD family phosphatase [Natranaerobius trueperi]OWZ83859.1 phosphatase [Natranaerobius trueperi]